MSRRVFDRAGLVTRRLRGRGKGRARGSVARRALFRWLGRLSELAAVLKEIQANAKPTVPIKRKAHRWFGLSEERRELLVRRRIDNRTGLATTAS